MKKKLLLSTLAAAAMLFTGAAFHQAEAASVKYYPTTQVTYKVATQEEAQKLIQQYFSAYNIKLPVQWQNSYNTTTSAMEQTQNTKTSSKTSTKTSVTTTKTYCTNNNQTIVLLSKPTTTQPTQTTSSVSAFEKKVVELTNAERAKQGLAPLTLDTALSKVAHAKAQDMKDKNYFDHNSPTYGSPFDMMKSFGISYKSAGENIAMGQTTPEQVVQAWMESPGHRENIMNSSFTHIGVGYVASGNYWSQMFIGK